MDVELREQFGSSWWAALEPEFSLPYMQELEEFLDQEKEAEKNIYPPEPLRFNAFSQTSLEDVRVVLIGQDPYPTEGDAHGLSFSMNNPERRLPKSLLNIFKELDDDLGILNTTGDLSAWANQGVLLLNAVLSVEQGNAGSHLKKGWETFTDKVVDVLNTQDRLIIFVLWGAYAQKKGSHIDQQKHTVISSAHPSPLAAYRGFWGSKPFSKINKCLVENGTAPIDWKLPGEKDLFS